MSRTRWLFLRILAAIFLIAFVSLWMQIDGLIGSRGILPAAEIMEAASAQIRGRFDLLPTLAWFSSGDLALHIFCAGGVLLSLLALAGVAEAPAFFGLWLLYLSLVSVSREFLSYQWDNLLLEAGFLAAFFGTCSRRPRWKSETEPPWITLWLFRWLLFRLMIESGLVKILSGDPAWKNLTALQVHFETQPLPTWIGWYAHQIPAAGLRAATAAMFAVELVAPFLIFCGRRGRLAAAVLLAGLQLGIALTGNYGFFNLLTIVLCVLLLDDECFQWKVRWRRSRKPAYDPGPRAVRAPRRPVFSKMAFVASIPLAAFVIAVGGSQLAGMVGATLWGRAAVPGFVYKVATAAGPFRTVNRYGLFAVMTTSRPEIVVEGSLDGIEWKTYDFKWKPGPTDRRPRFVAPHQPRLDWQMWFAALGRCEGNFWFQRFLGRLLEGSKPVVGLLRENPFPDGPPVRIRSRLFDYRFTDAATRAQEGSWWRRQEIGVYCPTLARPEPETRP